jgi:hypothetical protein
LKGDELAKVNLKEKSDRLERLRPLYRMYLEAVQVGVPDAEPQCP